MKPNQTKSPPGTLSRLFHWVDDRAVMLFVLFGLLIGLGAAVQACQNRNETIERYQAGEQTYLKVIADYRSGVDSLRAVTQNQERLIQTYIKSPCTE